MGIAYNPAVSRSWPSAPVVIREIPLERSGRRVWNGGRRRIAERRRGVQPCVFLGVMRLNACIFRVFYFIFFKIFNKFIRLYQNRLGIFMNLFVLFMLIAVFKQKQNQRRVDYDGNYKSVYKYFIAFHVLNKSYLI
jgi:hypothetical protein